MTLNRRYRTTHWVMPLMLSTLLLPSLVTAAEPTGLHFLVDLPGQSTDSPVSGRLLVMLSRQPNREPRFGPNWFRPEPFFGRDVTDWAPGNGLITLDDRADAFPDRLSKLPAGHYYAQAVLHRSHESQHPGSAPGNLFSTVHEFSVPEPSIFDEECPMPIRMVLDQTVPEPELVNEPDRQEISVVSPMLSEFHRQETRHRAMVILPLSYGDDPERRYPVIYAIPGFGGSHTGGFWKTLTGPQEPGTGQTEFIRVMLNASCHWGHHVFANSRTNGPRGDALVEELIPYIDANFRTVADESGRMLTGHSSGGWASLWLQVNYPDTFGGVWSIAPDPVDFRDFQQVDLYASPSLNMFNDPAENRRPIARSGQRPILWYDDFCHMGDCLKRGGQLRSFDAVFSPLNAQGEPLKLWDHETGRVNSDVAEAWRKYDIRLILENNWDYLQPKLAGKLHVIGAEVDTFYLEGAVAMLQDSLQQLGSDAEIEIVRDKNHSSVMSRELIQRNLRQMTVRFRY